MSDASGSSGAPAEPAFAGGLLPAVAQDVETGEILMLAWMNEKSWRETRASGRACYYSRSRQRLWRKGEESGHVQEVAEIRLDCDRDTILLKVRQIGGAACHLGYRSCFFRQADEGRLEIVEKRIFDPDQVYVGKK